MGPRIRVASATVARVAAMLAVVLVAATSPWATFKQAGASVSRRTAGPHYGGGVT